ncbi:P-loop containing nucleoside triphosphate hydrolase protein, partial [Suillus lakei]
IVVAGAVGSGKSSLVNLLSGQSVADTSVDTERCTREWKDYQIFFRNAAYKVFDTVGFASSSGPKERPKKCEKRQIGEIYEQGSIDLLLLCVSSRNFHVQAVLDGRKKIQDELGGRQVPVVLVVTHFEESPTKATTNTIDSWWSKKSSTLQ